MKREVKISIPNPCHEDWNSMTPDVKGRFCSVCAKSVIDFTEKSDAEVKEFIVQNLKNNICGRFKKSQISHPLSIQIPQQLVYSQTQYHRMFLLALFIIMGTTLFSCTDKNGNKQKIEKVEVVNQQQIDTNNITVGDVKLSYLDSLHKNIPPPPPPPPVDQVKFVKPKKISCGETVKKETTEEIYNGGIAIEIAPEYEGGIDKFYEYFKKEFLLTNQEIIDNGKFQVSFIIEKNGSLTNIKAINPIENQKINIFESIIKNSKQWKPGEQNGKKIRTLNLLSFQILGDTINQIHISKY